MSENCGILLLNTLYIYKLEIIIFIWLSYTRKSIKYTHDIFIYILLIDIKKYLNLV